MTIRMRPWISPIECLTGRPAVVIYFHVIELLDLEPTELVERKLYSNPEVLMTQLLVLLDSRTPHQSVIWELSRDMFRANPRPLFSHDSAQLLFGLPASSEICATSTQPEESAQPIFDGVGIGCFPTSDAPCEPA
ncbi:hypothetical protein B0H14DRAFT_2608419 [Mycena olivaceomarginata]|nr:hypothetical protein B0H14DRAFT_2608419 [Mycena olivaceomarginata]